MEFRTLEHTSDASICDTFNKAFANYFTKIHFTPEILAEKIITEDIKKNLSVGVFADNELIGFILHGIRLLKKEKTAYNAGTGVIPEYRGKHLTVRMYEYIKPFMLKEDITHCRLEVIDQNGAAVHSYEKTGFQKQRSLICFRMPGFHVPVPIPADIRPIHDPDWVLLQSFWDWQPTWQHTIPSYQNVAQTHRLDGLYLDGEPVGYVIFHAGKARLLQFAISPEHRRQGLASTLFKHILQITGKPLTVINVDGNDDISLNFLKSMGFEPFIVQFEMEWVLD